MKKKVNCVPRLGSDGVYRVMIDVYYYSGGARKLTELAKAKTGAKWKNLGCFMDTCCIATKEDTGDFIIEIDWRGPE